MSATITPAFVVESLILALELFDDIQRNGQLSPEALEAKIAKETQLRKALVALANEDGGVEKSPVGEPETQSTGTSDSSPSDDSDSGQVLNVPDEDVN